MSAFVFARGRRQGLVQYGLACLTGLLPLHAAVSIKAVQPSATSPQSIGAVINFLAIATDSASGPLTFQFNVTPPGASQSTMVSDFNVGTLSAGEWTSQPFVWFPNSCAGVPQSSGVVAYTCQPASGVYKIEVIAKDFPANVSASMTITYTITPLVTGSEPVVVSTANPLVALFSSPGCAKGSQIRAVFQESSKKTPQTQTNYLSCRGTAAPMTFEIAGMYASDAYTIYSETKTGAKTTNGPSVTFTTGSLPNNVSFPSYTVISDVAGSLDSDPMLLYDPHQFGGGPVYANTATDTAGNIMWYYTNGQNLIIGRPLQNGTVLLIDNGPNWESPPPCNC